MALVGAGQLYSVELKAREQYIVHPRYASLSFGICAYSSNT
jgi:hypothetical protein